MITLFFDYKMQDLTDPKFDKDDMKEIAWFEHWRTLSHDHQWDELIEDIFKKTQITRSLKNLKDLKTLGIIKQIGDYCIDYLNKKPDLSALTTTLKRKLNKQDRDNDEDEENGNIVSKATDYNCVQLMTIHASKGLEYPVVFSVAGFKRPLSEDFIKVFSYHKPDNTNGNQKNRVLSYESETNPISERKFIDEEGSLEWQRIFYVAYTRAKYLLLLPMYKEDNGVKKEYKFKTKSIQEFYKNNVGL